jgi:hypothetical protein
MRNFDLLRARFEDMAPQNPSLNPLKLYEVDPNNINRTLKYQFSNYHSLRLSAVVGENWDKQTEKLDNYDIMYSIDKHFNDGKDWHKTDFYQRAEKAINGNGHWAGRGEYSNIDEFKEYLDRIESLYKKIKSEGYRTQREIFEQSSESSQFNLQEWKALERNEITVHVGRNGEFIRCEDGWHRLAISKALNLDKVPVRIKFRHSEWQEERKRVKECKIEPRGHPDLVEVKKSVQ